MDLVGPLPETPRGHKYIMTVTDYFTKWAEAAALKDKTAVSVADVLYSVSICMHQCMHVCMYMYLINFPSITGNVSPWLPSDHSI